MNRLFLCAHATHPDWRVALSLVLAQLQAQRARPDEYAAQPTLGLLYVTEDYVPELQALQAELATRTGVAQWAGCSSIGISSSGVEYFEQPAMAVMLLELRLEQFTVFNGVAPLKQGAAAAHTALVHADPRTPQLTEMIHELADRTATGYLFGGLACGRERMVEIAAGRGHTGLGMMAGSVYQGEVSGVAFSDSVNIVSRVTQGCQPLGESRSITRAKGNVIYTLDDEPALPLMLKALGVNVEQARENLQAVVPRLRGALVGITPVSADAANWHARAGQFGSDTLVRHLVGIDPGNEAIVIGDTTSEGMQLAFCERNTQAAKRDLMRICAELRDEAETRNSGDGEGARIRGAVYVSCTGRGGPHFGNDANSSAELKIVQHALGDVPLIGFFAAGEIARSHLYGYTGVLTAFL